MKTIDEFIDTIHVNEANFDHIKKTKRVNGTLRDEIRRIVYEFNDQKKCEHDGPHIVNINTVRCKKCGEIVKTM